MEVMKASSAVSKKRKAKKNTKLTTPEAKKAKGTSSMIELSSKEKSTVLPKTETKKVNKNSLIEEMGEKYPILKNTELIEKFLKVPITNNQKGRIRQAVKGSLQGTSNVLVPDIIHNKILSMMKASPELTLSELRRIRILYNFLITSLTSGSLDDNETNKTEKSKKKKKQSNEGDAKANAEEKEKKEKKEKKEQKVKGPKRYVVFIGNLPLNIDKEKIMNHFSEMNEHIKDIRIPKQMEGKKSAIAYLELTNEPSFEFALSKHHSMMGSKRINVLYTAQKNGKITKGEAKSKVAKLIALQKSGKLVGSIPLTKKRSQRRLKLKKALAKTTES